MKYVYTVWLRDNSLPAEDPDYEWPACFVIDGTTESSAMDWGDRLAQRYAAMRGHDIVRSSAELLEESRLPGTDNLPVVAEGHDATDDEIGW
jgi:hypothetical protein